MMTSDLSVSSSSQEGLPVNILEALMAELPIVATDSRGHTDLVKDGVNGHIIRIDDMKKFTNSVSGLYVSNDKRVAMAKNCLGQLDGYHLSSIAPKMAEIYR